MGNSDSRYKTIFDTVGVSIWEEDWSGVIRLLRDVKKEGITDFRKYLDEKSYFIPRAEEKIKILDVNDQTLRLFKAKSKEQLYSSLHICLSESFSTFKEELIVLFEGKNEFESEAVNRTLTGEKIDVLLTLTHPEWDIDFKNVVVTIMDISKRKKVEKDLYNSIKEKEILLNELHHRTKNNMQVISGMLAISSDFISDSIVTNFFTEMQNRIYSMSMVHDELYHSKDLSNINLKVYLQELGNYLHSSYGSNDQKVLIKYDLKNVFLSIDTAIPLGLVMNELFSNAFKYAFPGNRDGRISVILFQDDDGVIEIGISDDGIGTNNNFRKNNSMGTQIIFGICENQLNGNILYQNKNGLSWKIKFKDDLYDNRLKNILE